MAYNKINNTEDFQQITLTLSICQFLIVKKYLHIINCI